MNKSLIVLVSFMLFAVRVDSQEDSSLTKRLNAVLASTEKNDLNTILDYTYPKLFTLFPREKMLELLKGTFDTEDFSISVDSVKVIKIFPVFVVDGESFAKIKHTMRMKMKFKQAADTSDANVISERQEIATYMETNFGKGNVRYDKLADALIINNIAFQVGIKVKEDSQWYFINLDEDNPAILNFLFSKAVIEKLATYK